MKKRQTGGIIHTYRKYDPVRFPHPAQEAPDMVSPAFEHMLAYGNSRSLTPEQLANAVHIDPSQIKGLGPSIESLIAMLKERKRKILATYETEGALKDAARAFQDAATSNKPPKVLRDAYDAAIRDEHLMDLERLWYRTNEDSAFARGLLQVIQRLQDRFEVEHLDDKYTFTGREPMDLPKAIDIKDELERIDELLRQLEEAAKNAKVHIIDLEALAEFAEEQQIADLERMAEQVRQMVEAAAEQQGLLNNQGHFQLTPKAYRLFQSKLLDSIFADLSAAKSGRHNDNITGDGAVEQQRTKPYQYGDSLANMDVTTSVVNAMVRSGGKEPVRLTPRDIEIHETRNNPKCATTVCMDMSGSMQWGGLYINVKRMALALHGLIRSEYPGDFVDFVEIASLPKRRSVGEVIELMPKPVTIREPVVRLVADMSDERISEQIIPPHFTNIQHGLRLARQMLQVQDTPNRQIILITDGLPTAHYEDEKLFLLYPPDPRTEEFTMREGMLCKEQGIVINIFLLSTWAQNEDDVRFAHRLAESTSGRVFFVAGQELERYVVWDYQSRRRGIIG
ncbi:MAG: hypothetical protein KDA54_10820 [Phycisphaerales bacterium]|nr:hypothetical protein [Phycisphaerales bacterium]